jgi:hypothetical protein
MVCRLVKPVDIGPVLSTLDRLTFVSVNQTAGYACEVVLQDKFTPELKQLLASLDLGGELARAILRRLPPGQSIPPHVDDWMPQEADWHRFQIPIITDHRIIMRWPQDGVTEHLSAGNLYEVNFSRTHEVVNNADIARVHLQIDQVGATI